MNWFWFEELQPIAQRAWHSFVKIQRRKHGQRSANEVFETSETWINYLALTKSGPCDIFALGKCAAKWKLIRDWMTEEKKHRKNCECCPGRSLTVSHLSELISDKVTAENITETEIVIIIWQSCKQFLVWFIIYLWQWKMESKYHKIRLMMMNAMGLIRGEGNNVTTIIISLTIVNFEFFLH